MQKSNLVGRGSHQFSCGVSALQAQVWEGDRALKEKGLSEFALPTVGYTPWLVNHVGQAQAVHQLKAGGGKGGRGID